MISFDDFIKLYDSIPGEPEFEIIFRDSDERYMIIKYSDHVSFQRCGEMTGSGEIDYQTFEELYNTCSVDGVCLKDRWDSIEIIEMNASFNLCCQEDITELKMIYHLELGVGRYDYNNQGGESVKEVIKIKLEGASGYCLVDEAYNDKLTICPDSIRYEYIPVVETETNIMRKWSYKTNSPIYHKVFKDASLAIEEIMNWEERPFCTDIAGVGFEIIYSDKTKRKRSFLLPGDYFKDCFSIIKQMIPGCEYIPAVLLTSEDYEDEEE